jgi:hypothetical protein
MSFIANKYIIVELTLLREIAGIKNYIGLNPNLGCILTLN